MSFDPKTFDEWYAGQGLGPFIRGQVIYRNCWDCAWLAGFKSRDEYVERVERQLRETEETLESRRYEHERDINRLAQPNGPRIPEPFLAAVRKLVIAGRTTGGTAGRDEGLCDALDGVEVLLPPYPSLIACTSGPTP